MTHREAVMTLYLASCALGGLSIVLTHATITEGALISALTLIVAIALFVRLEQIYRDQPQPRPVPASEPAP
jgi:hypothetical protein